MQPLLEKLKEENALDEIRFVKFHSKECKEDVQGIFCLNFYHDKESDSDACATTILGQKAYVITGLAQAYLADEAVKEVIDRALILANAIEETIDEITQPSLMDKIRNFFNKIV